MIQDYKKWLVENGKSENTVATYILNVEQYIDCVCPYLIHTRG